MHKLVADLRKLTKPANWPFTALPVMNFYAREGERFADIKQLAGILREAKCEAFNLEQVNDFTGASASAKIVAAVGKAIKGIKPGAGNQNIQSFMSPSVSAAGRNDPGLLAGMINKVSNPAA